MVEVWCEKQPPKTRKVEKALVIWQQKTCYLEAKIGYLEAKNYYLERIVTNFR
jgi:hypothetical protein